MNYMKQIAQMLGVELDEEFYIKGSKYKHKLTKDGLFYCPEDGKSRMFANWIFYKVLVGELEIIKKPILDDIEKIFLSNVIKPFRNKIEYIAKYYNGDSEYISIIYKDLNGRTYSMAFPSYDKGTMYKGMELDKQYTLEELGL